MLVGGDVLVYMRNDVDIAPCKLLLPVIYIKKN